MHRIDRQIKVDETSSFFVVFNVDNAKKDERKKV